MYKKPRLYLENSVISMYFQDNAIYLKELTRQFWENKLSYFNVFVSEVVLDEIRATEDVELRNALIELIEDFEVLELTDDMIELANTYLKHRRMPRGDALHLASASISEINFLVTWNLKHLYKRGTQEAIQEINARLMIPVPIIVTPEEFLWEET
jgi:predicted nucleic acid-binding protein